MDRFGLAGHPIGHSLSPRLFTAGYGGRYSYDLLECTDFRDAWKRFLADYKAINVTAPFKIEAARLADIRAEEVEATGAANILVKTPKGVEAHNSDYLGVKAILSRVAQDEGFSETPVVLVVGYGGAGRAASRAAKDLGMDVVICNRSTDKAPGLRPLRDIAAIAPVADIIIYNLPISIPEMEGIEAGIILEANYRDPQLARIPCRRYIPGTEWLLMQAVEGYALMSGEIPDEDAMRMALQQNI